MYYILTYLTVEDYIQKRAPLRDQHLALAKDYHDQGILLMGGALTDPPDKAVVIFKCNDSSVVKDFVKKDPYVQNGLVKSWEVREWKVVIGGN
jgi:uncharacterized protein YciI